MANVEPTPPAEPVAPAGPAAPAAEKNVAQVILEQLAEIRAREDQLANAMAKLAEKVLTPQGNQTGPFNPKTAGGVQDIFSMAGKALDAWNKYNGQNQQGPGNFFFDLYKKAHENFDSKVLMPGLTRMANVEMNPANGRARVEP